MSNKNRTRTLKILQNRENKNDKKIYFKPIKYPTIPHTDKDLYILTTSGDRLDILADKFYGDIRLWWIIATSNPGLIKGDSYNLKPNLEIRLPSSINFILREYEKLNK